MRKTLIPMNVFVEEDYFTYIEVIELDRPHNFIVSLFQIST